jgi:hypothetical protein
MAKVDEEGAALAGDLLQPLMKGFDALIGRRLVIILPDHRMARRRDRKGAEPALPMNGVWKRSYG